ncbi:BORE2 protein, partial [Amazona guildingii]|nr:BORE2 protein [Amazona guildingii]
AGLQQTVSRTVPTSGRVQGMLLRSKSVSQDKTSVFFILKMFLLMCKHCMADGDVHNIDVSILNQDTVQHIHNLVSKLTVLCGKAIAKPS